MSTRRSSFAAIVLSMFFSVCFLQVCQAEAIPEGSFEVSFNSNLITLKAKNAKLESIIAKISKTLGVEVKLLGEIDSRVTGSVKDVTFEELIRGIAVNWGLETTDMAGKTTKSVKRIYLLPKSKVDISPAISMRHLNPNETRKEFHNAQEIKNLFSKAVEGPELLRLPAIDKAGQVRGIVRSRYVRVNFGYIADDRAIIAGAEIPNIAGIVILNLFDDVLLTAIKDRLYVKSPTKYNWIGRITDVPFGRALLIIRDGRLTGNISVEGREYEIRYMGSGIHRIRELSDKFFLDETCPDSAENPEVPEPSTPRRLKKDNSDKEDRENISSPIKTHDTMGDNIDYNATADSGLEIKVLVVYTTDANNAPGDINDLIDAAEVDANDSYNRSGINTQLTIAHTALVIYDESHSAYTDVNRLADPNDGFMDDIHVLRDTHRADVVGLIIENLGGSAGRAKGILNPVSLFFEDKAFFVVQRNQAVNNHSFAHEAGHLMGARHDWYVDPTNNSPFTYNHGYVNTINRWRTIMAYNRECEDSGFSCNRIYHWSNPDVNYAGNPTGIAEGQPYAADNHKTLNNTAYCVANFRTDDGNKWGVVDIQGNSLILNNWGTVDVEIIAPEDGNYYVGVFGDEDIDLPPPWEWDSIDSPVVSLTLADQHTFTFSVKPDTTGETFQFRLYKETDPPVDIVSVTLTSEDTTAPQITSPPTVTSKTDTTAVIEWTTDEPGTSVVEYGTTPSYGFSQAPPGYFINHSVTLTDLNIDTLYHFRVGSSDAAGNGPTYSNDYTFTTESLDIYPPSIVEYPAIDYDNNTIDITFDEPNMQNANIEGNYSFIPSLNFATAGDDITNPGGNTYSLAMASIPAYTIFTLTVNNITDAAGNPVSPASIKINDDDSDDIADDWENYFGVDNPNEDPDDDDLTNVQEFGAGTDPIDSDTDDDDLPDGWEANNGLDPLDNTGDNGADGDFDNDGWTNYEEYINGSNPNHDNSPVQTPPGVREINPHHNAGINDSARVPDNTSFAVRIEDSDGIDITDTSSIKFTINDRVNPVYERYLSDTTVVRVVKLTSDPDTGVTKLWAVYDRSKEAIYGDYSFDADVNIEVNAKDRRDDWMTQTSYDFNIESATEHNEAQANLPDTAPVGSGDPALGGSYDTGTRVNSGDLEGAKIVYNSSEPVTPRFGPMNELPEIDIADEEAVGVPMNLQPPTVFNTPAKIFIPCPGYTDVNSLSVYLYNGTSWVPACDTSGNVQPGCEDCIVQGSRVNHNNGAPSTIEIQLYHFTGVQARISANGGGGDVDGSSGGNGGGGDGCFIATAAFGSSEEPNVTILKAFRDTYLLTNKSGQAFVRIYHKYSPAISDFIANHESLKPIVRCTLYPIVGLSYLALNTSLIQQILIVFILFLSVGMFLLWKLGRRKYSLRGAGVRP